MKRQAIVMGDGGTNRDVPYMDFYILAQTGKPLPKICFLGTASDDNPGYGKYFKQLFGMYPCQPSTWSCLHPELNDSKDARDFLMSQDAIYVGGGHTARMLAIWRNHGLDKILQEAYDNGVILSGGSAGCVCWFNSCITDSVPGRLTVMDCLGILPHTCSPHYSSRDRRNAFAYYVARGDIASGYGIDDDAGIHFVDGKFHRAISNFPHAKIYKVSMEGNNAVRTRLKTRWLGLREHRQEFILNTPAFSSLKQKQNTIETAQTSES